MVRPLDAVWSWAKQQSDEYSDGQQRPLGGYVAALGAYATAAAATAATARLTGKKLTATTGPWDVVLLGLASHKLSRLLAKDAVTSPLRAPFTHYENPAGNAELMESARHDSEHHHTLGELLTCPFCLDQWATSGFAAGLVLAPGVTRLALLIFSATAVSDVLQLGYASLQKLAS